jgi:hypothetical protein
MLWLTALSLFLVWGIALASSATFHGLIHLFLAAAIVLVVTRVVQGSKVIA